MEIVRIMHCCRGPGLQLKEVKFWGETRVGLKRHLLNILNGLLGVVPVYQHEPEELVAVW